LSFSSLSILYSKQRYGHRSTSLTPITSAMLCYVMSLGKVLFNSAFRTPQNTRTRWQLI